MQKEDKERVVAELTERLRAAETLIVADYRGLTMPQIDALRGQLLEHGAKFTVVKNTLTRRAAEAAGADALLALLEGPSAIAFIESDGDMVAVAKALADSARETKVLEIRGGVMQGRTISARRRRGAREAAAVRRAARPGARRDHRAAHRDLLGLVSAPLQNLVGLIDARIEQLGGRRGRRRPEPSATTGARAVEAEPPRPRPRHREPRQPQRRPQQSRPSRRPPSRRGRTTQPNPKTRRHRRWLQLTPSSTSSGAMTVLELVELKKKIEDEWGITAAAAVAVAAPGGGGGGRGRRGEDVLRRRPHRRRRAEDPGDQGRPRDHRSRPQGGQGSRRLGARAGQGRRQPGRGRLARRRSSKRPAPRSRSSNGSYRRGETCRFPPCAPLPTRCNWHDR